MSVLGPQKLTVEGVAFPAAKAPKVGDPLDVCIPWTGRGITVTVKKVEETEEGIVRWMADATLVPITEKSHDVEA